MNANEAAAFGMTVEEASEHLRCEVWPDNALTVNVFVAMATQWRVGPGGVVGLDYTALQPVMQMLGIPGEEWSEVFNGIRTMENAAMSELRKRAQ